MTGKVTSESFSGAHTPRQWATLPVFALTVTPAYAAIPVNTAAAMLAEDPTNGRQFPAAGHSHSNSLNPLDVRAGGKQ